MTTYLRYAPHCTNTKPKQINKNAQTKTKINKKHTQMCLKGVSMNSVTLMTQFEIVNLSVKYLKYHSYVRPAEIATPIRCVSMFKIVEDIWDANFINNLSKKKKMFQIILHAHDIQIICLMHLGCAKIATLIKGKNPEEIKPGWPGRPVASPG